jgi:lipoprotein Spr
MSVEQDIIQRYLGIPFKDGGEDLKGIDCRGLLRLAYAEFGEGKQFVEDETLWEKVENPRFFDAVLYKDRKGTASHIGLYLRENKMIHCKVKTGVVVTDIKKIGNDMVFDGFYRLRTHDKS